METTSVNRDRTKAADKTSKKFLTTIKERKVMLYGHVTMSSGIAKTVFHGTVQGGEDWADRGNTGRTAAESGIASSLATHQELQKP